MNTHNNNVVVTIENGEVASVVTHPIKKPLGRPSIYSKGVEDHHVSQILKWLTKRFDVSGRGADMRGDGVFTASWSPYTQCKSAPPQYTVSIIRGEDEAKTWITC